jgi:hypothetical protein
MSVDREHTLPVSSANEHSQAQLSGHELNETVPAEKNFAGDAASAPAKDPELNELLGKLNEVLSKIAAVFQTAFNLEMPATPSLLGSIGKNDSNPEGQSRTSNNTPGESVATDEQSFPGMERPSSTPQRVVPAISNERAAAEPVPVFANQTRIGAGLIDQARQIHAAFQSQTPAITQQEAAELLAVLRQLGQSFFEQGRNGVTKQELKRELDALRHLMESRK